MFYPHKQQEPGSLVLTASLIAPKRVDGEKNKRNPDQAEAEPLSRKHRLLENENRSEKLPARCDVLAKPNRRELDLQRGSSVKKQRDRRQHSATEQPEKKVRINIPNRSDRIVPRQISQNDRQEQQGFHRERCERIGRSEFLHQAVERERRRRRKSAPRKGSDTDRENGDSERSDDEAGPLQFPEPFSKENHREQDRQKRIDVISKTCLERVAGIDEDNENQPVGADEQGIEKQHSDVFRRTKLLEKNVAPPGPKQNRENADQGEKRSKSENIERIHRHHLLEIEREKGPKERSGRYPA